MGVFEICFQSGIMEAFLEFLPDFLTTLTISREVMMMHPVLPANDSDIGVRQGLVDAEYTMLRKEKMSGEYSAALLGRFSLVTSS